MADVYEALMREAGWEVRPQQARLVELLREAAGTLRGVRVVQAGTGVGKTLAVLATGAEVGRPGRPAVVMIHTNGLARQYVGKDAEHVTRSTGARITRVIGASYYVCASSPAARAQGVPQGLDDETNTSDSLDTIRERNEWLNDQVGGAPWATQWERQAHHDESYCCPGWPECEGLLLGGCGKRMARDRGIEQASVVVTNYHLAAIQALIPELPLLPAKRALTVVDEAHGLPDVVCQILSGKVKVNTGVTALSIHEDMNDDERRATNALRVWLDKLVTTRVQGANWSQDNRWQREQRIRIMSPEQVPAVTGALDAWEAARARVAGRDLEVPPAGEQPEGLSVGANLRLLLDSAANAAVVPTIYRPPTDDREPDQDSRPDTIYLRRADATKFLRRMLNGADDAPTPAALVSGTVPSTLAARCGLDVEAVDVGHPFDYSTQARGWLSRHDGGKSVNRRWSREQRANLFDLRAEELLAFLAGARGLVLCPSHDDVARLRERLYGPLSEAGTRLLTQPRYGGSEAAMTEVALFRAHSGPAVLIGTDSYATGLDLPGELLTRVAWWSLPIGATSEVDAQRQRTYPGAALPGVPIPAGGAPHGSYLDDRLRVKVVQGVGRLLRTAGDTGEVLLCDRRFHAHLKGSTTILDRHLRAIPWNWADQRVPAGVI